MKFDATIQLARKLRDQAQESLRLGNLEEASELLIRASSVLNGIGSFTAPIVQEQVSADMDGSLARRKSY
jgi:hypothetical protein